MLIISLIRLDEWIKIFNDTFYIVYLALIYNFWWPHVQAVPITTNAMNLNPAHGKVYSIQLYMIHVFSDLRQDDGFLRVPRSLQ
jgi:hypothetical protein